MLGLLPLDRMYGVRDCTERPFKAYNATSLAGNPYYGASLPTTSPYPDGGGLNPPPAHLGGRHDPMDVRHPYDFALMGDTQQYGRAAYKLDPAAGGMPHYAPPAYAHQLPPVYSSSCPSLHTPTPAMPAGMTDTDAAMASAMMTANEIATTTAVGDSIPKVAPAKKTAHAVPDEMKDTTYWDKRQKNNDSAKRSRESRRIKEEQIAMRVVYLEQDNLQLRTEVSLLKSDIEKLRCMLYNS